MMWSSLRSLREFAVDVEFAARCEGASGDASVAASAFDDVARINFIDEIVWVTAIALNQIGDFADYGVLFLLVVRNHILASPLLILDFVSGASTVL